MKILYSILFLLVFSLFTARAQSATVIAEQANLRGTPSQSGKVVDTVASGTDVEVIKQKSVWFLVQTVDYVGWMHGDTKKVAYL